MTLHINDACADRQRMLTATRRDDPISSDSELAAIGRGGRRADAIASRHSHDSASLPKRTENPLATLMVGCGAMGSALLTRWQRSARCEFTVLTPSGAPRAGNGVARARSVSDIADQRFHVLILAVKPAQATEVLQVYLPYLHEGGVVISMLAGVSCSRLKEGGVQHPVRIMPNLAVSIGKGVTGVYADDALPTEHRNLIDRLMAPTGQVHWVGSEDRLDRLTAVAGSGPGYAFELARCWVDAAVRLGFSPAEARRMVLKTLEGSVLLAQRHEAELGDLRKAVTSENGTTAAGLASLNPEAALDRAFTETVKSAYGRARELR